MLDRPRRNEMVMAGAPGQVVPEGFYRHPYYGYGPEEEEGSFDPLKLLYYVVQYRWLIVALSAVALVCGAVFTMMQTPQFRATSKMEVMVPSAKVFQDLEVVSETGDVRAFITAREKLKSRALAQRAVFQLGLSERPDFLYPAPRFSVANLVYRAFGIDRSPSLEDHGPEERERMAIDRVLDNLSVDLVTNTSLLSISYSDQDPQVARDVANQLARSFIDQRVDQTSETSDLARTFIEEQVLQVKERLQSSEQALVDYAKEAGITTTGEEKSLIAANIEALNAGLSEAIQEKLEYGRLVAQIEAGRGESLAQVLENKGLEDLRTKMTALKGEYQQKLGLLKPGFPEMQQLQAQIAELQRLYDNGVLAITDSIRLKHEEMVEKEKDLTAKLRELEQQQVAFNDKNIQYTILKREVDSNRSQYDSLIAKLNEVGVSSELKTQNAAIVDLAVLPRFPYSPRLSLNLAFALALALALAAAVVYVLELMNNTFTTTEQVEKELRLPVLGILPAVEEQDLAAALSDQRSGLSEAYRSLRTSLQFSGAEGMPRTLLVTSAEPAEGKSTTSFQLARDLGVLGSRVLLIDADMRKPNMHRLFSCDNTIGLSNLLTKTVRKEDVPRIFRKGRFENVTLLTSGTIPPNPADLLSSARMAMILESLAEPYDIVIIDAPPVVGLSDAPILSRMTEATLLVVSSRQVTRKSAAAALKRLKAAGANVAGVAMSKFTVGKFDYNYAYRYMNYEYYTYGTDTPQLEDKAAATNEAGRATGSQTHGGFARRLRASVSDYLDRMREAS